MLDVYFIRHAESVGNVNNHLIGGQSNHYPLTPRGEAQARKLGERLKAEGIAFDEVHSSPAVRALATAEIVCDRLPFPKEEILQSAQLLELSQGIWEGKVRKDHHTPAVIQQMRMDPDFLPPEGESQRMVEDRMFEWLAQALGNQNGVSRTLGVFSHGMAIKCLIRRLLEAAYHSPYYTILYNTSVTRIQFFSDSWHIERFNDHAHLHGMEYIGHYG